MRALILAAFIAFSAAPVAAHGTCGKRVDFIARLAVKYGETRQGAKLARSIMPLELYATGIKGAWTILQMHPPDLACIAALGKSWNGKLPHQPRGDPA